MCTACAREQDTAGTRPLASCPHAHVLMLVPRKTSGESQSGVGPCMSRDVPGLHCTWMKLFHRCQGTNSCLCASTRHQLSLLTAPPARVQAD